MTRNWMTTLSKLSLATHWSCLVDFGNVFKFLGLGNSLLRYCRQWYST